MSEKESEMQLLAPEEQEEVVKDRSVLCTLISRAHKKVIRLVSLTLLGVGNMDILSYPTVFRYQNAMCVSLLFVSLLFGRGAIS